jgi:ATP-dependent DNA helicase DinG
VSLTDEAARALDKVTAQLPGGGEARPGQHAMVAAVAAAIEDGRHLVVQAGTGTGKSLGYLVPVLLSGRSSVVATATKALQDQLAGKDLPFLQQHLGVDFDFAVLKGRSNYVCRQRLAELDGGSGAAAQLGLDGLAEHAKPDELLRIRTWAATSPTGDRAELDFEPAARTWSAVSVGVRECPGATRCPRGADCFTEQARRRAQAADVVVVNLHLLALDLTLDGAILPERDIVVIDEAHQTEDIVAGAAGFELTAGRFAALGRVASAVLATGESLVADVDAAGGRFADACASHTGRRIPRPLDDDLASAANLARDRVERLAHALRGIPDDTPGDVGARKLRAVQAATALLTDIDSLLFLRETDVAWVETRADTPTLRVAPIDVADVLQRSLWPHHAVVLTSATLPANLPDRLGLDAGERTVLDVGSPFDYEHAALLYCAADLPDPRAPGYRNALHAELESLIVAAGGRTLALFTSWKAMREAVEHLRPRLPWRVLAQGDLPKPALLDTFSTDEASCLFATMSFWQGVDVPGAALSLVAVDRLPFPRPDDPLLEARRERAGADAFRAIDLPRAAMLLAQGAGRLIRTTADRGVVAVLDSRLARARTYRWDIIGALPPMPRTKDRATAEAFLRRLRDAPSAAMSD